MSRKARSAVGAAALAENLRTATWLRAPRQVRAIHEGGHAAAPRLSRRVSAQVPPRTPWGFNKLPQRFPTADVATQRLTAVII